MRTKTVRFGSMFRHAKLKSYSPSAAWKITKMLRPRPPSIHPPLPSRANVDDSHSGSSSSSKESSRFTST